jgi:hypothetical protein
MKTLHIVMAVIELGAALALLCCLSATVALLIGGAPLSAPAALTVARVGDAGLLVLGVACWLARGDTASAPVRTPTERDAPSFPGPVEIRHA